MSEAAVGGNSHLRSDVFLVLGILCGGAQWVARDLPLMVVALATVWAWLWGYVHMYRYLRPLLLRRTIRVVPYLSPIPFVGLTWGQSSMGIPVGIALGAVFVAPHLRSMRLMFNRHILDSMDRQSRLQAWSESAFYLLPAVGQEYLYRFCWIIVLIACLQANTVAAIVVSAFFFSFEHLFGDGNHTERTMKRFLEWAVMGVVLGAAVIWTQSLATAVIAHAIVNLPAAIHPHLRGRSI